MVRTRLSTSCAPLRPLLLTLMTFDPPAVFIYNAHRKQGVNPNAAQFNCVLSTGLRPMDKTLFVRLRWQKQVGMRSKETTMSYSAVGGIVTLILSLLA